MPSVSFSISEKNFFFPFLGSFLFKSFIEQKKFSVPIEVISLCK